MLLAVVFMYDHVKWHARQTLNDLIMRFRDLSTLIPNFSIFNKYNNGSLNFGDLSDQRSQVATNIT